VTNRRRLRLALCGARGIPSTYSGTETFFMELAPRLVDRGHEVTVYCRRSVFDDRPPSYKGVRLIYLPSVESKTLSTFTHTLNCMFDLLRRDVDAILVTNVANALHCILPRLFGKKLALNVDGVEWKRGKWGAIAKTYFYLNARLCGKILPHGIITDAYEMRRIYLERFNTASTCIAYGANIECSTHPETIAQYGLEPGGYYLIASRLVPENNADLIVEGFGMAPTNRVLAIAGDANYKSIFVDRLKRACGPRVRFLGHVDNIEPVKELHCNAYAYIHGHMMGGTNPALLKALGYGNCILAHDNPFNAEVLDDYGILFKDAGDLAQKIISIERNPGLASEYRHRAPERIRTVYNWGRITDQYEELFHQLATGENPTRVHSSVSGATGQPDPALD
jgi:glycosyltransferase involved in cell wall biosynthesis